MDQNTLATGFLWFLAFLFSTTVHEAMHALAALKGGDPTAYHGGQVSLSPIPHIRREPIGMLVVPLLTALTQGWAIGWASTPYDTRWAAQYPKRAALMAAAGPAGNLSIALWRSRSSNRARDRMVRAPAADLQLSSRAWISRTFAASSSRSSCRERVSAPST